MFTGLGSVLLGQDLLCVLWPVTCPLWALFSSFDSGMGKMSPDGPYQKRGLESFLGSISLSGVKLKKFGQSDQETRLSWRSVCILGLKEIHQGLGNQRCG